MHAQMTAVRTGGQQLAPQVALLRERLLQAEGQGTRAQFQQAAAPGVIAVDGHDLVGAGQLQEQAGLGPE